MKTQGEKKECFPLQSTCLYNGKENHLEGRIPCCHKGHLLGGVAGLRETGRTIGDYFSLALCIFGFPSFLNIWLLLLGREGKKSPFLKLKKKKSKLKGRRIPELSRVAVLGSIWPETPLPASFFLGHCHILCEDAIWGHVAQHLLTVLPWKRPKCSVNRIRFCFYLSLADEERGMKWLF